MRHVADMFSHTRLAAAYIHYRMGHQLGRCLWRICLAIFKIGLWQYAFAQSDVESGCWSGRCGGHIRGVDDSRRSTYNTWPVIHITIVGYIGVVEQADESKQGKAVKIRIITRQQALPLSFWVQNRLPSLLAVYGVSWYAISSADADVVKAAALSCPNTSCQWKYEVPHDPPSAM